MSRSTHPKGSTTLSTCRAVLFFVLLIPLALHAGSNGGWVVGWGANVLGQATGIPTSGNSTGTVTLSGQVVSGAVGIAAGMYHGLAVRSDGTVVGWGANSSGQAIGSTTLDPGLSSGIVAVDSQVLSNVVAVAAGWGRSFAVFSNGTMTSWGASVDIHPLRIPPGLSNVTSLADWHGLPVKADGALFYWTPTTSSDTVFGQPIPGLSNVVAAAAYRGGHDKLVALLSNGTVVECSTLGGRSITPVGISNVTAIAAGRSHALALDSDGRVAGWGSNFWGETDIPAGLSNVVAIAAGNGFSLALRKEGTIVLWGYNPYHRMDVPANLSNVVAIAAGNDFSLAITTNPAVAARFMPKRE